MSKRRPPNRRRSGAARTSGSRGPREPELDEVLAELLADPEPLAFIAHASTFAELLTAPGDEGLDVAAFLHAVQRDTTGPLRALGAMFGVLAPHLIDPPMSVATPPWLARIAETRPTRAFAMVDLGGDSDQIVVEVRLATGSTFTVFALVDHDLGTAIKDGFALPTTAEAVLERWRTIEEPGVEIRDLPLADAGARLREALRATAQLLDPPASDTWPQARPLLDWVTRLLPEGGSGWPRIEWVEGDLAKMTAAIVRRARPRIGPDAHDLVDLLLHYAGSHGPGDPLRWSERSTDMVIDWLDRHEIAGGTWDNQMPGALRAVIRYAHRRRGLPPDRTERVLAVVDAWEKELAEERIAELLEALQDRAPDHALPPGALLRRLSDEVGGDDVLRDLSPRPIPESAADLGRIPADVLPAVRDAVAILEPVVAGFFDDPELRTAAVSFLARAAEADPGVFRRRSSPAMTAAAATWVVAKANDAFGQRLIGDLMVAFGLNGSASQRAAPMLRALGLDWFGPYRNRLGDAGLLTSTRRRAIIGARDAARAELAAEEAQPSPFPSSVTTPDGRRVEVEHRPGLADEVMEQLKPLLAADGIDLDDPDHPPDLATLQAGFDRAVNTYNRALSSPVGARRDATIHLLRQFAVAIVDGDDEAAIAVLDQAQPQSRDDRVPEVSAVIGVALGLVDEWLSGRAPDAPKDLGARLLVPKQWRKRARPAMEIIALGTRDRAADSIDALIARQGGAPVLAGAALAMAVAFEAWMERTGTPLAALLRRAIR